MVNGLPLGRIPSENQLGRYGMQSLQRLFSPPSYRSLTVVSTGVSDEWFLVGLWSNLG
jgi:hypothetical protein